MILAADVGGTKTALGLFDDRGDGVTAAHERVLPSHRFAAFEDLVAAFLAESPVPVVTSACFGVAGPVVEGRVVATNLPWQLDERRLAVAIPTERVKLVNDLEAMAHGLLAVPPSALLTLQGGQRHDGNIALIAAGTGLGEAILTKVGGRYQVVASEGGHVDFAPRTDVEIALLRFLRLRHGHVSYERVLSGPGLVNIYTFLRETGGTPEPAWLTERLMHGDPAAVISEVALEGGDATCAGALDLFVSIYGAEAGNLALKALAVGGVFLGGGIAPKIAARLTADDTFMRSFREKGRLAPLLAAMAVKVVLEPRVALLGAVRLARALTGG
ncbi:MAG TPA: glucokinase [Methylomirabilota bacterium]